ncbi:MAG: hypothetical protein ACYDCG_05895 [Candidatus Acidiferrales bacterium]
MKKLTGKNAWPRQVTWQKKRTEKSVCATWLLDGFALRYVSEEVEDVAREFGGLEAEGGGRPS